MLFVGEQMGVYLKVVLGFQNLQDFEGVWGDRSR